METLPSVLLEHLFSSLDFRQVASAATVCRSWNKLTSQAEIWQSLFAGRWGKSKASTVLVNLLLVGSWKAAYEVHHHRERIGKEWTIIQEGGGVYTAKNRVLIRCLVCPKPNIRTFGGSCSDPSTVVQSMRKRSVESCGGICTPQMDDKASSSGLLDKLLYFAADLHSPKHPGGKYLRICK